MNSSLAITNNDIQSDKGKPSDKKSTFSKIKITFTKAIIISFILHIIAALIYSYTYEPEPFDIPSVEVKIKIGSSGFSEIAPIVEKPKAKKNKSRKKVSKKTPTDKPLNREKVRTSKKKSSSKNNNERKSNDLRKQAKSSSEQLANKQNLTPVDNILDSDREESRKSKGDDERNTKKSKGDELGNKKNALKFNATEYEESIALWLKKHMFLPKHSREKLRELEVFEELSTGIQIHINRQGDILETIIIESSGYKFIDNLTLEIVKRSSPIPEMPSDLYPNSNIFGLQTVITYPVTLWQKELGADYGK